MSETPNRFPDNGWFDGRVASWEGSRNGYRFLFEAVVDPPTFLAICNSAGDDELIELHEPGEKTRLVITYLDKDDQPLDKPPVILDRDNPAVIIPHGSRFILDATGSQDPVSYTCLIYGEKPLV